ncbi:YjeE family ATPase [Phytophthora cinnamomi]|uniref:YjeE family ATPase n=1 Tax=Phytophthora cinnamomi TaxID=4785 RepID=UPI0035599BDA|nr:YjeE family ATPase [Phytophthora cinnamomi]
MLQRGAAELQRRCDVGYARRWLSVAASTTYVNKVSVSAAESRLPRSHTTTCARDMELLGQRLARGRQPGDVLFLRGDLGCGKTCLARGFVRAHTQRPTLAVTSPTYLLVNTYDEARELPPVFHVDLYRLDAVTEQDVAALGLADAFERGITLVEWPERLDAGSVPEERLDVRISYDEGDAEIRRVQFDPVGERWMRLFAAETE